MPDTNFTAYVALCQECGLLKGAMVDTGDPEDDTLRAPAYRRDLRRFVSRAIGACLTVEHWPGAKVRSAAWCSCKNQRKKR